jgi:hypothetical protein
MVGFGATKMRCRNLWRAKLRSCIEGRIAEIGDRPESLDAQTYRKRRPR